jgi:hypothetical protein
MRSNRLPRTTSAFASTLALSATFRSCLSACLHGPVPEGSIMKWPKSSMVPCMLIVAATTLSFSSLSAQQQLGRIEGEVTDSSGAKITGATVTAEDILTHYKTTVKTNGSGDYSLAALNPGTYVVKTQAASFGTQNRSNLLITSGQLQIVNFALTAGSNSETVEVSSEGSNLIDTGSANIATTFSQQEVRDLPNEGRNPFVLATLAVGVVNGGSGGYFQGKSSQFTNPFSGVSVQIGSNGNFGHNRLTLNGIPNDPPERLSGNSYLGFTPSPEAVQEVKVGTSIFDAQIGNGNGTVTNVVVRGGNNNLHGAGYYVFQNTYLNANTYEKVPNQNGAITPSKPTPRNNDQVAQTGFVIDGPVVIPRIYNGRNKTYFMASFEYYLTHTAINYSSRVPTAAERTGDFSGLCTSNGGTFNAAGLCSSTTGSIQLYDPLSPIDASNNRTVYFPNNQIPTGRLSPAGVALLNYYPAANVAGATAATPINYIATQTSYRSSFPSFITRFDQAFGQKNKLNATFFRSGLTQSYPLEGFPNGVGPGGFGYSVYRNNRGGSIEDIHQFSSSIVLDSRLGVIWHPFGLTYPGNSNFNLQGIGISSAGLPYTDFPGVGNSDGYASLASGSAGQVSTSLLGALEEIVTKTWGHHTVRFGFEGNLLHYNVQAPENGINGFNFDRTFTRRNSATNNDNSQSGDPIASLLLGTYTSAGYSVNANYALAQKYYAPFVQDDWRVTPKLTFNLGIRYDFETPFQERYNKQVGGFCATCANPYQAGVTGLTLNGGLTYTGSGNRLPYPSDFNNVQPRLGLAYEVHPNTVLRAGFGIIYFNTLESPIGTGFSQGTTASNYNGTNLPVTSLSNPFPGGVLLPTGASAGLSTAVGQSISFYDPHHVQPKSTQYTVNLQQQFAGNLSLQIAYVGQRPSSLEVTQNLNALPQQYYNTNHDPYSEAANYVYLTQNIPNPLFGHLPSTASSTLTGANIQRYLTLLPYPEFGSINEAGSSIGYQRYDALQIQVSKPMRHHVSFQGSFTWNKLINHTSFLNYFGPGSLSQLSGIQDSGATLIGNVFGTVELPKLLAQPAYQRLLLGGWKLNTVMRAQNGPLIGAPGGVDQVGDPVGGAPHNFQRMFNTCYQTLTYTALANNSGVSNVVVNNVNTNGATQACDSTTPNPAFRQRTGFTTQTNPVYINERQRIYPLVDASLFKQFIVHEGVSFEIRGEYFNIGNRPNFGGPGTGPGSNTYAVVTLVQANDPRIGQLTARINF